MKSFLASLIILLSTLCNAQSHQETFEDFWTKMDQNYAFFQLKEIDWQQVYQNNIDHLDNLTDEEFFQLLVKILEPFEDAHIKLSGTGAKKLTFSGTRPTNFSNQFGTDSLFRFYDQTVKNYLEANGFSNWSHKGPLLSESKAIYDHHVFEYSQTEKTGYIKICWFFYDYHRLGLTTLLSDRKHFLSSFEDILEEMNQTDQIILDLRNNIGGVSGYPERLAGFFTTKKQVGEYTQTRKKSDHERFSDLKPTYIQPQNFNYPGSVYLLTNSETVSASEEFVMMMNILPNVTLIGNNTQGAFSDVKEVKLKNGWRLSLSNMRFVDLNKVNHEGEGIAPDVSIFNQLEQMKQGNDEVLAKTFELIKQKNN
ncbi:MAG: hypothetical protein CMP48_19340 [Rickettsiales bacterium]|nr:hypothetical protein [Rickettsiales bacterium]